MQNYTRIVDVLHDRYLQHPDRLIFSFNNSRTGYVSLTYRDLWEEAFALSLVLRQLTQEKDILLISLKPSIHFMVTIFACILAERTFMPSYPTISKKDLDRTNSLVKKYKISFVIYDQSESLEESPYACLAYPLSELMVMSSTLKSQKLSSSLKGPMRPLFFQASSGTTRYPKAVIVDDVCLLACLENMKRALGAGAEDIGCSWLPPYHDMGLIGNIFLAVYGNFPVHFMAPSSFILDPLSWLQMITNYRVTITSSPNFGYDLCTFRFLKNPQNEIDLSSLRVAINGSEIIQVKTLEGFCDTFEPFGFQRQAFKNAYGLAEATLMVACDPLGQEPYIRPFSREGLQQKRAIPHALDDDDQIRLISSGVPIANMEFKIVDRESCAVCRPYEIGEIWVKGNSLTGGYYRDEEKTEEIYVTAPFEERETYVRTGDSGFVDEAGCLFVTGRIKDQIHTATGIVSAEDIESVIDDVVGLDPNYRTAVVMMEGPDFSEIIVVKEAPTALDFEEAMELMTRQVEQKLSVKADKIIYVSRGQIPRTTSGKIKRHATNILVKYDLLETLC